MSLNPLHVETKEALFWAKIVHEVKNKAYKTVWPKSKRTQPAWEELTRDAQIMWLLVGAAIEQRHQEEMGLAEIEKKQEWPPSSPPIEHHPAYLRAIEEAEACCGVLYTLGRSADYLEALRDVKKAIKGLHNPL